MQPKKVPHPVFDRIIEVYGLDSDAAMARMLDIYPQDVPRQRKKGNIPYKQILSACPPKDWEYIFTGNRAPEAPQGRGEAVADPSQIPLPLALQRVIDAGYTVSREPFQGEPIRPET